MAATAGNNCVRQLSLLRKDLDSFANATGSSALKGQIGATITSLSSELDRMEQLSKSETNMAKRDKHLARLNDLRAQSQDLKGTYIKLCQQEQETSRSELLGRRHNATPDNPYSHASSSSDSHQMGRQEGNIRESNKLERMGGILDEYIESGLSSLSDLRDQSSALKGTQKRLRDIAVGLGLSGDTIRLIERRTKGDKWVFYGGCLFTLICFFFILRYFG